MDDGNRAHDDHEKKEANKEEKEAEREDAALWTHFNHWVWDDAALKELP